MSKYAERQQVEAVVQELAETVGMQHGAVAVAAWVTLIGGIVQARVSAYAFKGLGEALTASGNEDAGKRVADTAEATLRNAESYTRSTLIQFVTGPGKDLEGMEKLTESAVKRVLALSGM